MLFKINKLRCFYTNPNEPVLLVDNLIINKGELTFIIGPSGVGKSTFLETLGMMNNTICSNTDKIEEGELSFYPNNSSKATNLYQRWKMEEKYTSYLRRKHFSFIFQNNNLMKSLNAYENIDITQMIQGVNKVQAREKTLKIINSLALEKDIYDKEKNKIKKISELSGGQQQRISFARAIVTDFTVLFGDEPTGNLDSKNAHNLMSILKTKLIEDKKSAIIVSHDINLAIEYADNIVLIQSELSEKENVIRKFGRINEASVFSKNKTKWNNNGNEFTNQQLKRNLFDKMTLI